MRDGIVALLAQFGPDTVVLQAGDATSALKAIAAHADLDAVILDLGLPGMGGMRALTEFGRVRPDVPVVVVSASEDARDAREALAKGALGYVPKSAGSARSCRRSGSSSTASFMFLRCSSAIRRRRVSSCAAKRVRSARR